MSTPTIKLIHSQESEPLFASLFKLGVLAVASVVILLIVLWSGSGAVTSYSHAIELHNAAMRDVPVEAGFLGEFLSFLRNAWDLFWVLMRVALWMAIGLAGVATILACLAGVGILTWIGKQIGYGFIKLVELVKYAWSRGDAEPVAVVDGKKWTKEAILADLDERVSALEAKGIVDGKV